MTNHEIENAILELIDQRDELNRSDLQATVAALVRKLQHGN